MPFRDNMPSLRLGYACINTELSERPKSRRICVNQSCIATTYEKKGKEYAIELARSNLENVLTVLEWNEDHDLRFYRLSSDMFPHITNPKFIPPGEEYAYPLEEFIPELEVIGNFAKEHGHRLTFHPGQFCQVGAQNPDVFQKTCTDLKMHADCLDLMGLDQDSVMVVHGGGTYGNKSATLKRWGEQFFQLPQNVQDRLVVENCERQYSTLDLLDLNKVIKRPVVFDTHHHACYQKTVGGLPEPETFLPEVLKTWTSLGIRPKFHISEQNPDKRLGAHSDYVVEIPKYLTDLLHQGHEIDLMIEAKRKELAVMKLYDVYGHKVDKGWYLKSDHQVS